MVMKNSQKDALIELLSAQQSKLMGEEIELTLPENSPHPEQPKPRAKSKAKRKKS